MPNKQLKFLKKYYPGSSNSCWVYFAEMFSICWWATLAYQLLYGTKDTAPESILELMIKAACFGMITLLIMSIDGIYNYKKVAYNKEPPLDPSYAPLGTLIQSFVSVLGTTLYVEQFRTGHEISDRETWRNAAIMALVLNTIINIPGYWPQLTFIASETWKPIKKCWNKASWTCTRASDDLEKGNVSSTEKSSLISKQ